MSQGDRDFEVEASERLSHLETKQDVVVDRIEDLSDGQDEIMDKLDEQVDETDELAGEEQLEELREEATKNAKKLERYDAGVKLLGTALTLVAGGSGYILYFV